MFEQISNKINSITDTVRISHMWKKRRCKIIWTNGVFDLLHPGHIKYLCEAKDLGDKLIIGVNSDASVQRLKGKTRPINDLYTRQLQLASLEMTDLVVPFDDDTPLQCIIDIQPDIIVKGGDYKESEVVGAKEVKEWGGKVVIIPYAQGYSSTAIVEKIRDLTK